MLAQVLFGLAAGAQAEASGGVCTVTCSQVWRGATALGLDGVAWRVRRRGLRVVRVGDARIMFVPDRHGTLGVTARRGESVMAMAVHGCGGAGLDPGRGTRRGTRRRSAVEYVIGAPRAAFTGAVSSRRPGLVALEIARKAITCSSACP